MSDLPDQFRARERSFEAAYFQKVDAQLIANLRNKLAELEEAAKLAHVSEILDPNILGDLVRIGVTAESLLAMRFVPMIKVAWSDRKISPAEQATVLKAAESENIKPGSPTYELLRKWLEASPPESVFVAWKEYIQELARHMPAASLVDLRERMAALCNKVAHATGGVLGIGSISQAERQAMDDCLAAYDNPAK